MANHRREVLLADFENAIRNLYYTEAMKKVGALYYSCADEAREKEAELLFLMKEYKSVVRLLSDSSTRTQFEKELYFVSLAYLDDFDSVNQFLNEGNTINKMCNVLVARHFLRSGKRISLPFDFDKPVNTFFQKQYFRSVVLELADIYLELEYAHELYTVGIDVKSTIDSCIKRVESVGTKDVYLNEIVTSIKETGRFNFDYVSAFEYIYIGKVNRNKHFFRVYTHLDDIVFHLDVEQKCRPEVAVINSIEYVDYIVDGAKSGNAFVGDYLKGLVLNSLLFPDTISPQYETTPLNVVWKDVLTEFYPEFLKEIDKVEYNNQIYETLSSKGKIAFKAATWQFDQTISDNYGLRDAGMLCLSYMRIIELELNMSIITELINHSNEIATEYNANLNSLTGNAKKQFIKKWRTHINCFTLGKPEHTLERLWYLFINLSLNRDSSDKNGKPNNSVRNRDNVSSVILNILARILNNKGMAALASGRFVDMINYDTRNEYRNPPAHTKYVSLETAFKCKSYVEDILLELNSYKL